MVSGKHQCVTYANLWHISISAIRYIHITLHTIFLEKSNLFILKLIWTDNERKIHSDLMKDKTYKGANWEIWIFLLYNGANTGDDPVPFWSKRSGCSCAILIKTFRMLLCQFDRNVGMVLCHFDIIFGFFRVKTKHNLFGQAIV